MTAPYRNDRDALEQRLSAVETELASLRARKEAMSSIAAQEEALQREAADVRERLLRERRSQTISLLDGVRVATPCHKSWHTMTGDDRKRFCGDCKKHVYDLSSMTRDEAEHFVREHEGPGACIRMHRRADGTLITADCPVGKRRVLRLRVIGAVAGVGLVGAGVAAWAMTSTEKRIVDFDPVGEEVAGTMVVEQVEQPHHVVMGEIEPVQAPTAKPSTTPTAARAPAAPGKTTPRSR